MCYGEALRYILVFEGWAWQYLSISNNIWQYEAISINIWKYPTILNKITRYITLLMKSFNSEFFSSYFFTWAIPRGALCYYICQYLKISNNIFINNCQFQTLIISYYVSHYLWISKKKYVIYICHYLTSTNLCRRLRRRKFYSNIV